MLSPFPAPHPLDGHPRSKGLFLPPIKGTLDVLEREGIAQKQGRIQIRQTKDADQYTDVAIPYIGDLLLFLEDQEGPYCLNWNIKSTAEGFEVAPRDSLRKTRGLTPSERAQLERQYYLDAGIRTLDLTPDKFSSQFLDNLTWIFSQLESLEENPAPFNHTLFKFFQSAFATKPSSSPNELIALAASQHSYPEPYIKRQFWGCIWTRQLSVELFEPIFNDAPLQPQAKDPLAFYDFYFRRQS
ncbi:hypothetical protein CEJ42_16000 [Herbaspirillum robiniae]|uniref:Uncharacterized protein n=2 Tax=Herbaspirillum robiniae TaxID=2014887 RepID=A0A246WP36_9BURK|nr:hypothetical protein CEJ42_16000 [Herbaspirillum robiniae]